MRKVFFIITSLLFVLAACTGSQDAQTYVIEGEVSDHSCDSAQIFLVPLLEPATHETVDSVYIIDGKFRFEGTKTELASLRLQMPQRMKFQELLVYTEPGTIKVMVAKRGSVTGTKSNDLLQVWKTAQEGCFAARDSALEANHENTDSEGYRHALDSLNTVMGNATYTLLKNADVNAFSNFFYCNNKGLMTPEQVAEFKEHEAYYQHMLDSIRKVRQEENQNANPDK